tara:strand:- start:24525 stop:24815 length:291 start_codon:yes stop_codon:yes gene_type:complete
MKATLNKLKKIQVEIQLKVETYSKKMTDLEDKIDKRESIFHERSDSWQDSERGDDYQNKTDDMQYQVDEMYDKEEALREILDNIDDAVHNIEMFLI